MTPIPVIPLRLAEATLAAGDITPVMLFPIGEWKTNSALYAARYPKGLPLTQDTADTAIANFNAGVLGGDVQFSLAGAHSVPAAAAFWVKRLYCAPYSWQERTGDALWADAKWTQAGADAANDDQYKYVSVELGGFTTNDGEELPWVLQGGVMTNNPLIRIMPPVRQGAEAIAASDGERTAEFEIALADGSVKDPVAVLLDEMDALAAKLDAVMGGKSGVKKARMFMHELRDGVSAHKIAAGPAVTKSEGDAGEFPAAAYAYVPDESKPSTWKLRLWATPTGGPNAGVVGMAIAALGRGFRGNKVEIPAADMAAVKAKVRVAWTKANSDKTAAEMPDGIKAAEDGNPAEDHLAHSDDRSHPAKDDEGQFVTLAEGDAATKGVDHPMNIKTLQTLKLAEGADDVAIDAAVMALAEERTAEKDRADTAELKLADVEKAKRSGEVEVELAEIANLGNLKPGEKAEFVSLAEDKPEIYAARLAERKALKPNTKLDLGVHGKGTEGDEGPTKRADVELAERTNARMVKDSIGYPQAMGLELSENDDLRVRYDEFLNGKEG